MNYLKSTPFTVPMSGGQQYRDNYDAINWGSKSPLTDRGPDQSVTIQQQVREFHETYGQPIADKPCVPADERVNLRIALIGEEFCELLLACGLSDRGIRAALEEALWHIDNPVNLVEVADALGDLAYVIEGANLEFGIDSAAVLAEIQRSNMSKLGEDGKPIYSDAGKVLKGPNYSPPNLRGVLGLD